MHLIITEKHDAARRIAAILSGKKPKQVRVSGVDTYEFDGKVVMGLSGHVVELDFPKEYNNWQKIDLRDLINAEIITHPTQGRIVAALKSLGKKANHVTIATDYDREGELIGVEALDIIKQVQKDIPADRVRYSTITEDEIPKAFAKPSDIDFNLADAGESRQVIDLVWGATLTRFVSLSAGRLGSKFLSVGRVQSPTLALIVDRERERIKFVPEPYWELYATLVDSGEFEAQHIKGRFTDKEEVEAIRRKLGDKGTVTKLEKGKREDKQPTPFNTTEFLRAASSIGFSASNAMRIAESLYIQGFISYPRTDNTVYPASINLRSVVSMLSDGEFREYAQALLAQNELKPTRGKKETTDHPPIYPASSATKSKLKEEEWKLYELVVRRFFATLAGHAVWETLKVSVDISGEEFTASGARLVDAGWRWYYSYNVPEDRILPELHIGEVLTVKEINIVGKETQPPSRYGQGHLIKIMEDLGLGTKSTRHETIAKLYARAYVHGNPLQPTKTAFAVIEALEKYANQIVKPDMTSKLETDMDAIAEGKLAENDVVKESRDMLGNVFRDMSVNREEIREALRNGIRSDLIVGKCNRCGADLIIRKSKKGGRFIGCTKYPECDFALPLPKFGQVVVTEKVCDTHGLSHLRILNKGKRPWDIGCPQCNFDEWKKKQNNSNNSTGTDGTANKNDK